MWIRSTGQAGFAHHLSLGIDEDTIGGPFWVPTGNRPANWPIPCPRRNRGGLSSQNHFTMEQKTKRPRKANDELLKGAFKENFPDFLHFLYPQADVMFDLEKGVEFLDKELLAITPDRERTTGKRIADLLAKVHMKDGTENCILVHTEIEGGRSKEFALRMFQYHYRLLDLYQIPVETIAVFTGGRNQPRPSVCQYDVMDTSLDFRYRAYHIFDHDQQELLKGGNIFAPGRIGLPKGPGRGQGIGH